MWVEQRENGGPGTVLGLGLASVCIPPVEGEPVGRGAQGYKRRRGQHGLEVAMNAKGVSSFIQRLAESFFCRGFVAKSKGNLAGLFFCFFSGSGGEKRVWFGANSLVLDSGCLRWYRRPRPVEGQI